MSDLKQIKKSWEMHHCNYSELELAIGHSAMKLLLQGKPVALSNLAQTLGKSDAEVRDCVLRTAECGECTLNDLEEITGLGGLTLVPTPHKLTLEGGQFYTWCALDALAIPVAWKLNTATIRSRTVDDNKEITLQYNDGEWSPRDFWISLVDPMCCSRMHDGTCKEINFYSSIKPNHDGFMMINEAASWGKQFWKRGK